MLIREAQKNDWPEIYQLIENNMQAMQLALGLAWNKASILDYFMSKDVLVSIKDKALCGFIAYELRPERQIIHSLQIVAEHQNGLLGYRLFKAAFIKGNATSLIEAEVSCRVFENNHAQQQYFALGFKEISKEKGILALTIPRHKLIKKLKLS